MSVNPVQWGTKLANEDGAPSPEVQAFFDEAQQSINSVEEAQSAFQAPSHTSSSLPTASQAGIIYLSDINMIAFSNGANWYRADTGVQL